MKLDMRVVQMPDIKKMSKKAVAKVPLALNMAAQKAIGEILDRTEKGRGVNGMFEPYSEKYAWARAKRGASVSIVNLTWSGQMLASMTYRATKTYAEIYFMGKENNKKAYFNDKRRPFFDLNEQESKLVLDVFKRYVGI